MRPARTTRLVSFCGPNLQSPMYACMQTRKANRSKIQHENLFWFKSLIQFYLLNCKFDSQIVCCIVLRKMCLTKLDWPWYILCFFRELQLSYDFIPVVMIMFKLLWLRLTGVITDDWFKLDFNWRLWLGPDQIPLVLTRVWLVYDATVSVLTATVHVLKYSLVQNYT